MTYRCGIGNSMQELGFDPCAPHLVCDGCGMIKWAVTQKGDAPQWLLKGKAPPGWAMDRHEDDVTGRVVRKDYCPRCRRKTK
jgi:hypothetical protein